AEDGIRGFHVTGVQTCALPILNGQPVATAAELLQALDAASPDAAWTLEVKSAPAPGAAAGGSPAVPEVSTVEVPVPAAPLVVDRSEERRVGGGGGWRERGRRAH